MVVLKNLFSACFAVVLISSSVAYAQSYDSQALEPIFNPSKVIRVDVESERIPAGTILPLRLESPVNSYNSIDGDVFRATIIEDIRVGNNVILPAGTLIRGRVQEVRANSFMSRSGKLSLTFDHIVTPVGRQIPFNADVTKARYLTTNGTFAGGGGYVQAVEKNVDVGSDLVANITQYSKDKGLEMWNGWPVFVTTPVGVAAGVTAGGGYFIGKSAIDLFRKGDNVKINPGDIIEVTLVEPLDVPAN